MTRLDLALLRWLRTHGHAPAVERAALAYTKLGERSLIWVVIALLGFAFDRKNRPVYKHALRALAVTQAANFAIKVIVRRRRPVLQGLPQLHKTPTNLSYPSAHSSSSFAAARSLSTVLPSTVTYGAAAAMAMSRVYLGAHYPTDIVAGAALGLAIAELTAGDQ